MIKHFATVAPDIGMHEVRTAAAPGAEAGTYELLVVANDRPKLLSWIAGALVDALSPHAQQDSVVRRDGRIPTPTPDKVRLILSPDLCRRAIAAWFDQGGIPNPWTQVYLFDLGGDGYALFDPAQALGNAQARVPVLSRDFRLLTILSF